MRQELDKQMAEKADRARANKEEDDIYTKLQEEHVKLLAMRELEKKDKESRDRQLQEEKRKRRADEKNAFRAEVELVERLQKEMEAERQLQAEKREQERNYLKKMLVENETNKRKAEEEKLRER